jgi:hypothetical protein
MKPLIQIDELPAYPNTVEAIAYAEDYRLNYLIPSGNPRGFHVYTHTPKIDVKACGGLDNYFVVYSYPPGGFWYESFDYLETLESMRAWLLHYHPPTQTWTVIAYSLTDGFDLFRLLKHEKGL